MPTRNLLYKREIQVNDKIKVVIPEVGQILDDEDGYYGLVSAFTATPYDMMVQLDDAGIDFTQIGDYDLFLFLFRSMREADTSLLFGDLDLSGFYPMVNPENDMVILRDDTHGITIDRGVYDRIADAIRTIHHLKRNSKKPGNNAAKKYMLQRARQKLKRHRGKIEKSHLEELIVALVNTEQFSYRYDEVLGLTIYQFNESVQQIIKKIEYDNRMHGIYAGTVKAKDLSQDDLNWLTHK